MKWDETQWYRLYDDYFMAVMNCWSNGTLFLVQFTRHFNSFGTFARQTFNFIGTFPLWFSFYIPAIMLKNVPTIKQVLAGPETNTYSGWWLWIKNQSYGRWKKVLRTDTHFCFKSKLITIVTKHPLMQPLMEKEQKKPTKPKNGNGESCSNKIKCQRTANRGKCKQLFSLKGCGSVFLCVWNFCFVRVRIVNTLSVWSRCCLYNNQPKGLYRLTPFPF